MELQKLKYFYELVQYISMSEASHNIHVSQPTLSNAIKDLEKEYGIQLLNRSNKGIELTPQGELFYQKIQPVLFNINNLEQELYNIKNHNKLNLGIPPMIATIIMPKFAQQNRSTFLVKEFGTNKLLKLLEIGELDVIIIPNNEKRLSKYQYSSLFKTETVFCTQKENPKYLNLDVISPDEINHKKVILFTEDYYHNMFITDLFKQTDRVPEVVHYSDQVYTIIEYIKNGIANGFLIKELVEDNEDILSLSIVPKLFIDVTLVWRKQAESNEKVIEFIKLTNDVFEVDN